MAQLIEVDISLPARVTLSKGDVLYVKAFGGHINAGHQAVEMLGPFHTALLQEDGSSISPMGGPGAVLFLARQQGTAQADAVIGDPWHSSQTIEFEIIVGP